MLAKRAGGAARERRAASRAMMRLKKGLQKVQGKPEPDARWEGAQDSSSRAAAGGHPLGPDPDVGSPAYVAQLQRGDTVPAFVPASTFKQLLQAEQGRVARPARYVFQSGEAVTG